MSVKQCTGKWSPVEDRILFRFNTAKNDEYIFWLTRHVVNQMIHNSVDAIKKILEIEHDPTVAKTIQEFQQAAVARKTNFKSKYDKASEHPLGKDPLLVVGYGVGLDQKNKILNLQFRLISKQRVGIKLTIPMVHRIVSLLEKLQLQAGWSLTDDSTHIVNAGKTIGDSSTVH